MAENQNTGLSDSSSVTNLPSSGVQYQGSVENLPNAQPITEIGKEATGPSISKTVQIDRTWSGAEPAMRQAVDVEISSLRTHLEECINATNTKLNYAEELFKTKLDNVEIKLNGRIELLDTDLQSMKDKHKAKKDRRWDIIILCISIIAAVVLTVMAEKWIIPFFQK